MIKGWEQAPESLDLDCVGEPLGKIPYVGTSLFQAEVHDIGTCAQFNLNRSQRFGRW